MGRVQNLRLGKKHFLIFLVIIFSIALTGCLNDKEPVPFFDGLLLEYKVKYSMSLASVSYMQVYKIRAVHDGFKVIRYSGSDGKDTDEEIIDSYGKIKKETSIGSFLYSLVFDSNKFKEHFKDKFSSLWIPTNKIQIGDKIDSGTITRKEHWREWEVLVLNAPWPFSMGFYYDVDTGYLVGSKLNSRMKSEQVLVNTNAEIAVEDNF